MSEFLFKKLERYIYLNKNNLPNFFYDRVNLKNTLSQITLFNDNDYLFDQFINWLYNYCLESKKFVQDYISGEKDLKFICIDFIGFCFQNKIKLDAEKILNCFNRHNKISDQALKKELLKIPRKSHLKLLGFGLDDGWYEKELAKFLINSGISSNVNVYGLDPYAKQGKNINYLSSKQLLVNKNIKFDIIIARWSLHHVKLEHRWHDLKLCMQHCNTGASILFVEHGFIKKIKTSLETRFYELLNATFDIVANIGLRPYYFTETAPEYGKNFYIKYINPIDVHNIFTNIARRVTFQKIYDIGPIFPNQTIFCTHL